MKASRKEQLKLKIAETASKAYVGFKSGEFNTTRTKMRSSIETVGIIDSVLTVNKTLYVIAYRVTPISKNIKVHADEAREYYNCKGDVTTHSPFELLMPLSNIDLSRDIIDPRRFVGGRILVSEIDGQAIKAEYIGEIEEYNESPLAVPRALLASVRNYVGSYVQLNDSNPKIADVITQMGLGDVVDDLYKTKLSEWSGKAVSIEGDGLYTNDTNKTKDGEVKIQAIDGLMRHLNGLQMKSKNCHLPVKLFSAR